MTILWIGVGWLAIAVVVAVVLCRAIARSSDGRPVRGHSRRIPHGIQNASTPSRRPSPGLRNEPARSTRSMRASRLHALVALLLLGACAMPTSDEPRVTSSSGNGATVEYSGERAGEADRKAREACARSGKQAGRASTRPGATGGSVRSYDCTD